MWKKILSLFIIFSALLMHSAGFAQGPGVLRPMEKRAITVTQMKNRFVAKVLDRYGIGYRSDSNSVITGIDLDGVLHSVARVDITPVFDTRELDMNLLGHEIYFFTEGGTLQLFATITAKR